MAHVHGTFFATSDGTVQMRHRQHTPDGTYAVTVKKGSRLVARQV